MESKALVLALGALIALCSLAAAAVVVNADVLPGCGARMVARESRKLLVATESGVITAVDVDDAHWGKYHVQFISLEPASLFLPVLLHTEMAFYVQTGRGTITYMSAINEEGDDDEAVRPKEIEVMRGDVYMLEQGTVFYVRSHPDPNGEGLRINAIFSTAETQSPMESLIGAYSNINELVRGFDAGVLQMGFGVSEEIIQGITSAPVPPSIVPVPERNESTDPSLSWKEGVFEALVGVRGPTSEFIGNKKKKKEKKEKKEKSMRKGLFNFFDHKPDVQNCNGWSTAVTHKDLKALRSSSFGAFMVNLTRGAMMGPHWNPKATEIAVVIHGQGMVQVVCPTNPSGSLPPGGQGDASRCRQRKFRVREGDLFIVPRYYAMAQVAYNNDTFVFVGFSTASGTNHPQYLAGKRSVLRTVDRAVLAASLGAPNTTAVDNLLAPQGESIILACTSCAEELERKMEEEAGEEERGEGEEEARRRKEEEEARRRQEEEEETRRREEEEARRRQEEEETRGKEEEEAKRRQEEETRRREEEEEARRRQEEEEAGRREEEEEARRRQEEEEEEARRREEEEARRPEEGEGEGPQQEQEQEEEEEGEWGRRGEGEQGEAIRMISTATKDKEP